MGIIAGQVLVFSSRPFFRTDDFSSSAFERHSSIVVVVNLPHIRPGAVLIATSARAIKAGIWMAMLAKSLVLPTKVKVMEFLTAPANVPFAAALAVVLLLGVVEVLSLLMGGASSLFDSGDVDADLEMADADGIAGWASQALAWLHVGQMPSMILLIVFLLCFGSSGLALQGALHSSSGNLLPAAWASLIALTLALPGTRVVGGLLKPLLPRDETEAVSHDSFVGCEAQITSGTARWGKPAEARLRDKFGRSHYILIEPDKDDEVFQPGSSVLVLKRREAIYRGVQVTAMRLDD